MIRGTSKQSGLLRDKLLIRATSKNIYFLLFPKHGHTHPLLQFYTFRILFSACTDCCTSWTRPYKTRGKRITRSNYHTQVENIRFDLTAVVFQLYKYSYDRTSNRSTADL